MLMTMMVLEKVRLLHNEALASSNNNFGFQGWLTSVDVPGKNGLVRNSKLLASISEELCLSAKNILPISTTQCHLHMVFFPLVKFY